MDYFRTGNQFFAPVQNQKDIKTLGGPLRPDGDGVDRNQLGWIGRGPEQERRARPTSPIKILQIPTQAEEILQMQQDRAQASLIGFEGILDLQKQQPDKFYTIGDLLEPGNYGIGVAKESTELRDAIKATMDAMKADGTYAEDS